MTDNFRDPSGKEQTNPTVGKLPESPAMGAANVQQEDEVATAILKKKKKPNSLV